MTSADLSAEQLRRLCEQLAPVRDYQCRLHDRLVERGFEGNDPLYREAAKAKNAVAELFLLAAHLAEQAKAREVPRWVKAQGSHVPE